MYESMNNLIKLVSRVDHCLIEHSLRGYSLVCTKEVQS